MTQHATLERNTGTTEIIGHDTPCDSVAWQPYISRQSAATFVMIIQIITIESALAFRLCYLRFDANTVVTLKVAIIGGTVGLHLLVAFLCLRLRYALVLTGMTVALGIFGFQQLGR